MKVLSLPFKRLDLCVARMTTQNGGSVSRIEGDEKNSILNKYFRARYIETQIRYIFNCKQYHKKVLVSSFLLRSHTNP